MNIPHKFLINNCLSEQKKKFYEKLSIRYSKIITEFVKKKSNIDNYQMKVINWLFNQDEETKMILCSVENKKYTNTIYEAFNYYNNISDNVTFKIIDNDSETDNDKYKLDYNDFNYNKYFNKTKYAEINNYKKKNNIHKIFNVHNKFLNNLLFYQCESPINDYNNYSNYFTLNPKFLKSDQIFKNQCSEITNNQFLKFPIKTKKDNKNKNNLLFLLPNWIQDNNNNTNNNKNIINDNYPYDTDENININNNNNNNYFTLDQYILALIEQVLSIRYILYTENKNLDEIISSTYLYDLFDKKKLILSYINNITIETSMYYKFFKIEDINAKIFFSQDNIEKFIKDKIYYITNNDNTLEDNDYSNNDNDSAFMNIESIFEKMVNKYKNDKKELNKELINMCMFFQIQKLFTLDDFFFRAIFENFYSEYLNQIYNDLIIDKEEKPKKKKKKKKKNNNTNSNDKQNNKLIEDNKENTYKEEIFIFIKNLILDNLEEKINKKNLNNNNNNDININNKKQKNNKKEKIFFLYESVRKKEKKKLNQKLKNNNNNNRDNSEKNNNSKEHIIKNNDNNINNETIEKNDNINKSISINNSINNNDLIIQNNNIFANKMNISYKQINKLNDDIYNFDKDMESLLIIIRKIKNEIQYHFELIIKNIYDNNSKLEIYGSSLYQLDIESSDLDLGISTKSDLPLDSLVKYLTNNNSNNQYLNINYIYTASIPIIKLEVDYLKLDNDKLNNFYKSLVKNNYYKICINNNIYKEFNIIKVDISLKSINHNQINFIKKGINAFPQIKPLIKIIKKLLIFKNMNNSYKGGMSSYCLFLIVYSYLKLNQNYDANNNNYSTLLMGFLYHYIKCIDFKYTIIDPSLDNPFIVYNYIIETIPTIIDPVTMNNAGKIIFRIMDVVNSLKDIYNDILIIIKENQKDINIIYKLFSKYQENLD